MNPAIDPPIPPSANLPSGVELSAASLQPAAVPSRRLKGKIPSLPNAHRDTISRLLSDGATYALVAQPPNFPASTRLTIPNPVGMMHDLSRLPPGHGCTDIGKV